MLQARISSNRLYGLELVAARMIWGISTVLIVSIFMIAAPVEYQARIEEGVKTFGPALKTLKITPTSYATFRTLMDFSLALVFCAIGIVLFLRKPSAPIVILSSITIQAFIALFVPTYTFLVAAQPAWTAPVSIIRAIGLAFSLIVFFYLIPDGRFIPDWTRHAAKIWIGLVLIWLFFPDAPANLVRMTTWSSTLYLSFGLFAVVFSSGIYAQYQRFRLITDPIQRQQAKWFIAGTTLGFIGFVLYHLPLLFLPGVFGHPGVYRVLHIFAGIPIFHLYILMLPVCIAIAISRYRLWDIDRLINRVLIGGTLTVVLVLLYSFSVILLSQLFVYVTGWNQGNLAVAISTLAISLLFFPLRSKVQDLIDRRFYRKRYKTEQALAAVSISLRNELDLEALVNQVISLVQMTVQPAHISLWIVPLNDVNSPSGRKHLHAPLPQPAIDPLDPLLGYLLANPNIIEIEHTDLESHLLTEMRLNRVTISVPLVGQGSLIGLINLGRRLSEEDYSLDDFHLLTILASQMAPALRVAQLVRLQQADLAQRQQEEYEMNVARQIQLGFLPRQMPILSGWHIAAHYQPATAVGGDFYNFQPLHDGRLALFIGDVSGHGVPAALLMVKISSLLKEAASQFDAPGRVLQWVNDQLLAEMPPSMFVTCLYAVLDPVCGKMVFANAGHDLPMRRVENQIEELWASGFPLGMMPGVTYDEQTATLLPGEIVLFFSDGLVEAHNSNREMFGDERIRAIVLDHDSDAQNLINELLGEMSAYIGDDAEQEDDVTIVTVHWQSAAMDAECI